MMVEKKEFPLAVVLSAVKGVLLCDIGDVYEILNYLTGDSVFTHQLPRVGRECAPYVFGLYPELAEIDVSVVNPENWREWLAATVEKYGSTRTLEPMADGAHEYRNPITELAEMVGPDCVIVLQSDGPGDDE